MKILRCFAYLVIFSGVAVTALIFAARFADGPIRIIAGGPFKSGEEVIGAEPDWAFVRDTPTVALQLLNPARSRTTWIIEHEGKIYIPCGYMTTTWGKIWKKWPLEAQRDGRAILRVDGKLYARQLVRLTQGPALPRVVEKLAEKYHVPATMDAVSRSGLKNNHGRDAVYCRAV